MNLHFECTNESTFLKVLKKHAHLKKKVLSANHLPYMTKQLRESYDEKVRA